MSTPARRSATEWRLLSSHESGRRAHESHDQDPRVLESGRRLAPGAILRARIKTRSLTADLQRVSTSPFAARRDAQTGPPVVNREPISPELVLVDLVLAQAERARLVERAQLDSLERARSEPTVDIATLRRAVESQTATPASTSPPGSGGSVQWLRERPMAVVLMLSLLANGVLLAVQLNGNPVSAAPVALRSVSSAAAPQASAGTGTLGTKGVVERKVVMRLLQSSAGRLPPQLTDRTTGLLKNGVQVVCHGLKAAGAFLCAVRVPGQTPPQAVSLRYRTQRDGRATFTWSHGWHRTRTRDLHQ